MIQLVNIIEFDHCFTLQCVLKKQSLFTVHCECSVSLKEAILIEKKYLPDFSKTYPSILKRCKFPAQTNPYLNVRTGNLPYLGIQDSWFLIFLASCCCSILNHKGCLQIAPPREREASVKDKCLKTKAQYLCLTSRFVCSWDSLEHLSLLLINTIHYIKLSSKSNKDDLEMLTITGWCLF